MPHADRRSLHAALMGASLSSEIEMMVPDSITSESQGSSTPGSRTDAAVLILQAAEPFDLLSVERQTNKKTRPGETKSERKSLHTRQLKKFTRHSERAQRHANSHERPKK